MYNKIYRAVVPHAHDVRDKGSATFFGKFRYDTLHPHPHVFLWQRQRQRHAGGDKRGTLSRGRRWRRSLGCCGVTRAGSRLPYRCCGGFLVVGRGERRGRCRRHSSCCPLHAVLQPLRPFHIPLQQQQLSAAARNARVRVPPRADFFWGGGRVSQVPRKNSDRNTERPHPATTERFTARRTRAPSRALEATDNPGWFEGRTDLPRQGVGEVVVSHTRREGEPEVFQILKTHHLKLVLRVSPCTRLRGVTAVIWGERDTPG